MFHTRTQKSTFNSAISILELIYHATVRDLRKSHGNAVIGLLTSIMQTLILVAVFYVMFSVLGLRGALIRGDFLLYILSGIFLFLTHNKAVSAVAGAEGPTSAMMNHAPMNTVISTTAAAFSSLYIQTLALCVVVFVYHAILGPIEVFKPVAAFGMFLLAWFTGIAVGLVFLALKPWIPGLSGILMQIYIRSNMITSGKMFVANALPSSTIAMFDWNPLFHCIDQTRGFAFLNYNPHHSSVSYPLYVALVLIVIGLMGEFYTRRQASLSWFAGK